MNLFDVGGIVTVIAGIVTLILGTGIFFLANSIFDITYFGCGAIGTMWFGCVIAAAFIVNMLGGLVGGIFSVIWFLIRLALTIGLFGSIGYYLYNKFKGNKE